jgi:hypothetical protein
VSRPSPVRDAALKRLARGPATAKELANAAGTTINCMQVSLCRWCGEDYVRLTADTVAKPFRYELGKRKPQLRPVAMPVEKPKAVHAAAKRITTVDSTRSRPPKAASQVQIRPAKPDPNAVNREFADRQWALSQVKHQPRKPGEPETVAEFLQRGGKVEQLPGPTPVDYLTLPAFPGRG